jgi:YD repeat-containing protein
MKLLRTIARVVALVTFVFPALAHAERAPKIWYNVSNWYVGSDILNHRFPDPGSAFSSDWDAKNPRCADGEMAYRLDSVYMQHVDGYEDGDLYNASLDVYAYSDCSYSGFWPNYLDLASRYAVCDIRWTPYSPDSYPGGLCGTLNPDLEKNKGHAKCPCDTKGDPVNPSTGNKFEQLTIYEGPGGFPLKLVISYNSFLGETSALSAPELYVGARRVHNYMRKIDVETAPAVTTAYVVRPDGKTFAFNQAGALWVGDADVSDQLIATYSGSTVTSWLYQSQDGSQENYDGSGKLVSIVQRGGLTQTITYDLSNRIQTVTDPNGRTLSFAYDTSGRVNQVTDPTANIYEFSYDSYNNLQTVTYPDLTTSQFTYGENTHSGDGATSWDLTGIQDENGKRVDTTHYDANDRVYSVIGAVGANPFSFAYADQPDGSITYTFQEPLGESNATTTQYLFGVPRPLVQTRSCSGCSTTTTSYEYDAAGYVSATTDFNGVTTCSTYDDASGLQTVRIEGVASNPHCTSPIAGVRSIQTDWNTTLRVPTERRVLNASAALESKTDWIYNTRGQVTAKCDIDPADTSGYVCSATTAPSSSAKVRRWTYTYCDTVGSGCPLIGLLKTGNGPRLDVSDLTSYAYYATTDLSGCATLGSTCHYLGDVQSITNALGHVTTYVSYDKNGRPTRIKDANSTLTDLTYHARGWLLTRKVRDNASGSPSSNDATTTFTYDNVGNATRVTQPDGDYLSYTYDDAHRLTDVADNLGNRIHYTLDAAGNRTAEQTYDPSSALTRTLSRQYDQLNRLTATLNAASTAVQTYTNPPESPPSGITYTDGYDGNGNAIYSIDGTSNHVGTVQQYDPLNRLVKTLQDHAGTGATHNAQTQYMYDVRDNLRSVVDPDSLTTSYTYDGLNNLTALSSPDTGSTGYTYDAAGNRISQTDARSVTTTYTYDVLNRLIGLSYPTRA